MILIKPAKWKKKLRKDSFSLDDFLEQLQQVRKLGSMEQILSMIPGMGGLSKKLEGAELNEKELKRTEAIIRSMTRKERRDHTIINGSRRKRIALGSGMKCRMSIDC